MKHHSLQTCMRTGFVTNRKVSLQWIARRSASSLDHLHKELTVRQLQVVYDQPNETNSRLLDITLADFLPPSPVSVADSQTKALWKKGELPQLRIRPGHHLVYWQPSSKLSLLLPDGTDPDQSPGEPFVRRMWAGGRIKFPRSSEMPPLDGSLQACVERISDVVIKGEKVFVTIERSFSRIQKPITDESEDQLRKRTPSGLIEYRDIVFMKESPPSSGESAKKEPRIVKAPHEASVSHSLVPTESLLFRFSALTFNAHRIHLDREFCRKIEGHRDLVVHGPLSLTLILELLNRHLQASGGKREIQDISYRNVAPLYATEKMTVCLRDKEDGNFDVWVENKDGSLAVKGTASTHPV